MKKLSEKFIKILMLISMIFSSLQTPIYVFADMINEEETYQKGDMRLGETGEILPQCFVISAFLVSLVHEN